MLDHRQDHHLFGSCRIRIDIVRARRWRCGVEAATSGTHLGATLLQYNTSFLTTTKATISSHVYKDVTDNEAAEQDAFRETCG